MSRQSETDMDPAAAGEAGVVVKRKLIEVSLPLEAINRESAREKSIRHGHPSTLHLWWARRPLAAARAVLFAQLVDDPSSHPDRFPTEADQRRERERLHGIIERLVVWENIRDEKLLAEAHAEILASTDGNPPPILDPFAGGGTIPLEAQRLGLEAHASDLNPVAVLINKALIEIPPKFRNQPPVAPGLANSRLTPWRGAEGLAADVRYYGEWMRDEAKKRIGHLYPDAVLPDGSKAPVIAWIWARTVTCPNPACGIEMPLVRSWWLGKKKGKEAYVVPQVVRDRSHPSGKRVDFTIGHTVSEAPTSDADGTVGRTGATCVACASAVDLTYIRTEGRVGRLGAALMAVVADGRRGRLYLCPDDRDVKAANVPRPGNLPSDLLSTHPQYMGTPRYGLTTVDSLFTARQLTALATLTDLVHEVGVGLGRDDSTPPGYSDAVSTYLGLSVSKLTNVSCTITTWMSDRGAFREAFARQALPMTWDYAESNPFHTTGGSWLAIVEKAVKVVEQVPAANPGIVVQTDARTGDVGSGLISTDPPYYDNIPYADLSDFFIPWLRQSMKRIYPEILSTVQSPKAGELVADSQRHAGRENAKKYFETGFGAVFERLRVSAPPDFPIVVYYAFKQSEFDEDGQSSSGWETLLQGMVRAGWTTTATWPVRTEGVGRIRAIGSNALASSIVLALRPRHHEAPSTDRRGFIRVLQDELPHALRELQQGPIAPVDLPQAAIGPGMAVFSRYSMVRESDGSAMTVRAALARINEILDQVLNEQEGDFDPTTRFAVAWYRQRGYTTGPFGEADSLARARNTSVDTMHRDEILTSAAGKVTLLRPGDLPAAYDVLADDHTSAWEAMHHLIRILETDGVAAAGTFLGHAVSRPDGAVAPDLVKELAFLLFSLAEKNGWTKDALAFNTLATSWPDILDASQTPAAAVSSQATFDFDQDNDR